MHELPVTQNILDIAIRYAGDAKKITRINLVIGDLSSIVGDSVKFYWDMLSKDTIAEGAELHFIRIKTRFRCSECQHEFELSDSKEFTCPECGSIKVQVIAGKEFRMDSIEIE
jgi:hydrogenase nickel incorporation protein HypA/HybF